MEDANLRVGRVRCLLRSYADVVASSLRQEWEDFIMMLDNLFFTRALKGGCVFACWQTVCLIFTWLFFFVLWFKRGVMTFSMRKNNALVMVKVIESIRTTMHFSCWHTTRAICYLGLGAWLVQNVRRLPYFAGIHKISIRIHCVVTHGRFIAKHCNALHCCIFLCSFQWCSCSPYSTIKIYWDQAFLFLTIGYINQFAGVNCFHCRLIRFALNSKPGL